MPKTIDNIELRAKIIAQAEKWARTSGLSSYVLVSDEGAAGYVNFKVSRANASWAVLAVGIKNGIKTDFYTKTSRGYGFDKQTAALAGWNLNGTIISDSGVSWQRQLEEAGYEVVRTL